MRPRKSRIFYKGKFFDYPLRAVNALRNLGADRGGPCASRPTSGPGSARPKDQTNFEGWVVARFGWRLYRHFFKTYTEKVWGVPVTRDAGRLGGAADQEPVARQAPSLNALLPKRNQKDDHLADRGVPVPASTGPG